ncbi:MAG: lysyl endopeptidase domain protein [Verrucomicrobiales bacterium]|nr:lysyl endopeptidase domain protein [Verrucomicrobiales bacterium]
MNRSLKCWIFGSLALLLSLIVGTPVLARNGVPPLSRRGLGKPLGQVRQHALPATDAQLRLQEDKRLPSTPLRFAIAQAVQITLDTHGTWENVPGGRLWRLRLHSAGATDLNFAFTTFWLPDGATLHINSLEEDYFQGPYTSKDNKANGQLWTPVIPGGSAWIELFVPADVKAQPRVVLTQVNTGYRDMFRRGKDAALIADAGLCENDVVCPAASPWTNEIRSVARYSIAGVGLCSGTLISDAAGDLRNFFLSANHCHVTSNNAASVVVYWNYQSPTCGAHSGGSLSQNQIGTIFRAAKADVDFLLLELEDVPDPAFKVFYSGWDRSGAPVNGVVGIHHPDGGVKSISFSSNAITSVTSCIAPGTVNTHWQVVWSSGVTEVGSSGSGIWNPANHRLLGTLSGGNSDCTDPTGPDCYGKFSVSWGSGAAATNRLRDWLDPLNTAVNSVPGVDPAQRFIPIATSYTLTAESCSNNAVDPGEAVTVQLAIQNLGTIAATNVFATLLSTGGVMFPSAPQNYGTIAGGATISRGFTFTANGNCGQIITPTLQLQSGSNNYGTISYSIGLGQTNLAFTQNFDGVTTPALPSDWTTSVSNAGIAWLTTVAQHDTLPNSVFSPDQASNAYSQLTSPAFTVATTNARLVFRHNFNLENGFDGGALDISINNGPFNDIELAGGVFLANGYIDTLDSTSSNPLAGRAVWTGNSGGFVTTVVQLPPAPLGAPIKLRWSLGSDGSVAGVGWYVDTVKVEDGYTCCQNLVPPTIVNPRRSAGQLAFSYNTVTNQTYVVESTPVLGSNQAWTAVKTNVGSGALQSFTNTVPGPQQFFRLRTQ